MLPDRLDLGAAQLQPRFEPLQDLIVPLGFTVGGKGVGGRAALGIADGSRVRIVSRRGACVLPASVDGRSLPRRGLVFVPFFDESRLINDVTLDAYCPISKEPDYKKCAVRLEKV